MEVWALCVCLILVVMVFVLMKQNPHVEEARKDKESKPISPSPSSYPSNVGKQLEHSQEELDKYMERLNHVLFDREARERAGHREQKSHRDRSADVVPETKEHSEKEAGHSQHPSGYREVQEKTTPPGSTESIVEETEQVAEEAADTDVHERRRQRRAAARRQREGHRFEAFQPDTDAA